MICFSIYLIANILYFSPTEIKPKTGGGGPQSLEDDDLDLFEKELRSANEEMMREVIQNYFKDNILY